MRLHRCTWLLCYGVDELVIKIISVEMCTLKQTEVQWSEGDPSIEIRLSQCANSCTRTPWQCALSAK